MFCRNQTSRATVARGSALEMEVKRGQFRLSVLENSAQDCEVQKLIEREVRIRDGTCKLLAACSQRDQALEASKTLLTSNSRILALMSRLQRMKEAQAMQRAGRRSFDGGANEGRFPCTGKVAISDVRIPLMWKDSEYFKNKGELHQCAVFGLLRLGTEIHNTDLVIVDRTLTDICFDETLIFSDVPPDFELRVELYSCCVEEDFTPSFSGRKLSRLGNSVTRASSKKFMATLETATGGSGSGGGGLPGGASLILPPIQPIQGPKYHLLAHTSLNLGHIQNNFRTHNLTVSGTEDTSFWLPLYGNMCCRLVAQPLCMTQDVICGNLRVRSESSPEEWIDVYGVLKATELICYKQKNDAEGLEKPVFTILINKDARVRATEKDPSLNTQSITISNQSGDNNTYTIITQTPQDTQRWMEAFWQHFYDMSQWKLCCETLMKIEEPSSRKPGAVILKQGSLYHEMVTPSTTQTRNHLQPLNTPVSSEIQSLLSTYFNDSY